jgi:hypothetical protein
MIDDAIHRLEQTAEVVRTATRARPFEAAVEAFVERLAMIPDYPASDASDRACDSINALSEQVIALIETRLEACASAESEPLAAAIYEIRRLLEEIFTWRRHYTPPSD